MASSFLLHPPHPETEGAACTLYSPDAKAIRPILEEPLNDPSICAGPDGWYYLTGTAETPGIRMWKSRSLTDWTPMGIVSDKAAASPEVHYFRGTFWLTYADQGGGTGLMRSETGSADGPYADLGMVTGDGNDASLFVDDDGTVYWVYGDGNIARMKDDASGLVEKPCRVEIPAWKQGGKIDKPSRTGDLRIGSYGAHMKKINGLYFLFCADPFERMGSDAVDTFVAVSSHVYGPYSRRYLAIPHGGQATFFTGGDGELYAAFMGNGTYSAVRNRPAVVRMELSEDDFIRPAADTILEKGQVAALHPVGSFPIRDPHICLGHDGAYYLTGTSNQPHQDFWYGNDELHVWTSDDLKEWKHIGNVWDLHRDGTWQNAIYETPCLWAPEISYLHGTYWLTYSLKSGSTALLKSTSGKADGPYVDMGRMTNTDIDSSLFLDDDGSVYYVWQDGKIAKLKPNMAGFAEPETKLLDGDGVPVGYEGAFIVKYKGKYILGAAEWNGDERVDGTYDLMYAVSDKLFGPYSKRRVAVPHGGHGTMFVDRDGRLMSTLFGNDRTAPFRARTGVVLLTMEENLEGVRIYPAS
jgi:beta-xylosidase